MKQEALIFAITTIFFALVAPAYWFITGDPTGTAALTMTALLAGMVGLYLGFHAEKMDARPEDRQDGEIADGAGELGSRVPAGITHVVGDDIIPGRGRIHHIPTHNDIGANVAVARIQRRCARIGTQPERLDNAGCRRGSDG